MIGGRAEALASEEPAVLARVEQNLGMLAADRGEPGQAAAHYDACERLAEASKDAHLLALCLLNRAEVLVALGRSGEGRRDVEAADVHRVLGLCDRAEGLLGQAEVRLAQGAGAGRRSPGSRLTEAEAARDHDPTLFPFRRTLYSEGKRVATVWKSDLWPPSVVCPAAIVHSKKKECDLVVGDPPRLSSVQNALGFATVLF